MKKVLTVIGARPQFIKASVVSRALARTGSLLEVLIHTGQHFDANMSDVFFTELSIPKPQFNLDIHGGSHGAMTGRMLGGIEGVLFQEQPDLMIVYGDTNSTLAGALAAAKLHVPVAHVEAGLRSFNMRMPEEVNRILTDRISTWLFAPTDSAVSNLLHEGMASNSVHHVGDVMYDVAVEFGARVGSTGRKLESLALRPKEYVLATVHRAENTDSPDRLLSIAEALADLAAEIPVVWPLHPRTKASLARLGRLDTLATQVHLLEPIGYLDMVQLEKYAALVATDSGGIQKEAYFHRVPCVTFRAETEWTELIDAGWNRLAPPDSAHHLGASMRKAIGSQGDPIELYGSGSAADEIARVLAMYDR